MIRSLVERRGADLAAAVFASYFAYLAVTMVKVAVLLVYGAP